MELTESGIFWTQYRIIIWKLLIISRRLYIRTLLSLLAPLTVIVLFRYGFYNPVEPGGSCYFHRVVPPFITLDIFTLFGYFLHMILIVNRIISEKYHQQQTLLFVMGCKKSAYYLSNITFDLLTTILMATYLALCLRYIILVCSYLPFLLITMLLHALQTVAFSYLLCNNCLFTIRAQQPSTLITIAILIWFMSKTVRVILEFQLGFPSDTFVHLISFFNCMLPQCALFEINPHIVGNIDLRFDRVFRLTARRVLPLGFMWLAMLFSSLFSILISWYCMQDDESFLAIGSGGSSNNSNNNNNNNGNNSTSSSNNRKLSQTDNKFNWKLAESFTERTGKRTSNTLGVNNDQLRQLLANCDSLLREQEPSHLQPGIKINHVSKSFGKQRHGDERRPVVDNLSLIVYKAQTTILLGHNGAGKTTLMKMIIGLLSLDEGYITIAGRHSINRDRNLARLSLGYCPQASITFDHMTVEEHLQLFAGVKCLNVNSEHCQQMIQSVVEGVKLVGKETSLVSELSGGMIRKLSLAIALIGDKQQVLILDEPSSGLDPESRESIWNIVQYYRQERAILITTQHMEEADYLGDRIAIMSQGRIVCSGSSLFLKRHLGNGYVLRLALARQCTSDERLKVIQFMRSLLTKQQQQQQQQQVADNNKNDNSSNNDNDNNKTKIETVSLLRRKLSHLVRRIAREMSGRQWSGASEFAATTVANNDSTGDQSDLIVSVESLLEDIQQADSVDYSRFFQALEQNQQELCIESFGIACPSMEDVFNNISLLHQAGLHCDDDDDEHRSMHSNRSSSSSLRMTVGTGSGTLLPSTVVAPPSRFNLAQIGANTSSTTTNMDLFALTSNSQDTLTGWPLWWQHVWCTMTRHTIILCNNWLGYVGLRLFYFALTYMMAVLMSRIRMRQMMLLQQMIITYTLYTFVPFLLPFMVSHYIYLSNRDKVSDGSKFMQQMAGLSPLIYWLVQFIFDLPSMLLNALLYIMPVILFDRTAPFSTESLADNGVSSGQVYFAFIALIVGFSSGSALLSYALSGLFSTPSIALVTIAMYHVMTFLVTSVAIVIQQKQSQNAYEIYIQVASFLNPGFALTDGIRKLYQVAAPYDNQNSTMSLDQLNDQLANEISKPFQYVIDKINCTGSSTGVVNGQISHNGVTDATNKLFSNDANLGIYLNFYSLIFYNLLALMVLVMEEKNYSVLVSSVNYAKRRLFASRNHHGNMEQQQQQQQQKQQQSWAETSMDDERLGAVDKPNNGSTITGDTLLIVDASIERERIRAGQYMLASMEPRYEIVGCNSGDQQQQRVSINNTDSSSVQHKEHKQTINEQTTNDRVQTIVPLIAVNLSKRYKTLLAVDGFSMALNEAECFGLLGVNGAGKSTTFSMISTKIKADCGELRCLGYCPHRQRYLYRQQLGYDPQMSVTFYDLTCRQTLYHMAQLRGMKSRCVKGAVEQLMSVFDMEEHADKLMHQLSGGTKRKLSLALAMICVPPVLLLDEPTAGVDPLSRRSIWHCIVNCKKRHNCSIVISSHAMEECEAICDRIALMANGRLYCLGSFQQLRTKYSQGYVIRVQFDACHHVRDSTLYQSAVDTLEAPSPPEVPNVIVSSSSAHNNFDTLQVSQHRQQLSTASAYGYVNELFALDEQQPTNNTNVMANLHQQLTTNLMKRSPSITLDYVNMYTVIYRVNDAQLTRSKLFEWMELEREALPKFKFTYLISDTSLEDVFLTFARRIKQQQQQQQHQQ